MARRIQLWLPEPASTPDPADGVFETLLARDGSVQALERHLGRLAGSVAELYDGRLPPDLPARLRRRAQALAGIHRLRVRAVPAPGGVAVALESEPLACDDRQRDVSLLPVPLPGGLGAHKWCDRRRIDSLGLTASPVPLILDPSGDVVLEAAWGNVWTLRGTQLSTPPADGRLLAGITRQLLLELAPELGLSVVIEPFSLARAGLADALFLTSSLRHAVIGRLDEGASATLPAARSVVRRIREALAAMP